jgi:hypothetical protein
MDHELLDQKGDFFIDRDEAYSSVKHEFSRIFHENNLHSFANASDLGFLEIGKLASQGFSVDYEDARGLGEQEHHFGRPYQKEEASPYAGAGMNMHSSYSPMRFLPQPSFSSNMSYNPPYSNLGHVAQKMMPTQETAFYQDFQRYKSTDYGVDHGYGMEYGAQANNPYTQNMYDMPYQMDLMDSHPNNALSMMWSNDTAKATNKQTNITDGFMQQPSQNPDSMKKTSLKIEQDFEKVSNKTLGLQMGRVTGANHDLNNSGPRRTTRVHKPVHNSAMLSEENEDSAGSDDDKDEAFGDSKNRSSRGLRVLSLKVRDIVSKKKKTSYKEVAEALLQDLNQKMKGKSQAEISKEEQNVKRRVYDALNVLIAADVLRKEGKLVCCENSSLNQGAGKRKQKNDKESLIEQIQEIKKRKKEKMEALQELVFKSLALRNLVRRNKEKAAMEMLEAKNNLPGAKKGNAGGISGSQQVNATKIEVVQENASLKSQTQDVINFPFIVVVSSSAENNMNLNMDNLQRHLSIESKKEFNIYGDIDVLLKMKLHYVPRETFEKEIPKELRKYVSPSFTDALK